MAKGLDSAAGGVRNDQEVAQNGPRSEGETYPCYCQMSIRSAYRVVKVQIPQKQGVFQRSPRPSLAKMTNRTAAPQAVRFFDPEAVSTAANQRYRLTSSAYKGKRRHRPGHRSRRSGL